MDRIRKGRKQCYIGSCRKSGKEVSSLHEFPSNAVVRNKWFESIGLSKEQQENLPDKALVCNLHFSKDSYKHTISGRKILKCDAFPTLFLNTPVGSSGNTYTPVSECVELNNCISNQIEPNILSASTQTSLEMERIMIDKGSQVESINLDDIKKYKNQIQLLKQKIKRLTDKEKTLVDKLQEANEAINDPYYKTLLKIKNDTKSNNNTHATFLMDQISNYGKQKPRFSELTMRNCISWRRRSPIAYKYCQSTLLKLPSRVTINRYLGNNTGELFETSEIVI